jgi:hypothetical protein
MSSASHANSSTLLSVRNFFLPPDRVKFLPLFDQFAQLAQSDFLTCGDDEGGIIREADEKKDNP